MQSRRNTGSNSCRSSRSARESVSSLRRRSHAPRDLFRRQPRNRTRLALQGNGRGMATDVDVLVVGGGISGLATAFWLKERGANVELLEAAPRAGGVIGTRQRNGALVEHGPNSTLDTSPLINELLDRLGIRSERVATAAVAATRFRVRDGQLVALPTTPGAFGSSPTLSVGAKLRLLREPFIGAAPPEVEESIATLVRPRARVEFLE